MGGGIIASYLRHEPEAPVAGVVLDSPMLDFGETVSYGAEQEPLPLFGHVPAPLTWTAKQLTALRYGVDWAATDYLDDTGWLDAPALVIHGSDDTTVPLRTSEAAQGEPARPGHPGGGAGRRARRVVERRPRQAYDEEVARFLRRL